LTAGLEALWRSTQDALPGGFELLGVTYHGPDHPGPWIAFAERQLPGDTETCEGVGESPDEALASLREHIAKDHQEARPAEAGHPRDV
jgi:hypothetical protein